MVEEKAVGKPDAASQKTSRRGREEAKPCPWRAFEEEGLPERIGEKAREIERRIRATLQLTKGYAERIRKLDDFLVALEVRKYKDEESCHKAATHICHGVPLEAVEDIMERLRREFQDEPCEPAPRRPRFTPPEESPLDDTEDASRGFALDVPMPRRPRTAPPEMSPVELP
eukprot:TRINITY_DN10650_c0_g1_i3.p1 TRINITY_DN10650_c0_g1~~TRINITY_DN10650_c0_g1_i3.p1  ORF type:complete len:171 (-),score=43.78 TRINITY_DN10650_c0_g1_i3:68-580(-)